MTTEDGGEGRGPLSPRSGEHGLVARPPPSLCAVARIVVCPSETLPLLTLPALRVFPSNFGALGAEDGWPGRKTPRAASLPFLPPFFLRPSPPPIDRDPALPLSPTPPSLASRLATQAP